MLKKSSFFGTRKTYAHTSTTTTSTTFKDFHNEWLTTLTATLLPNLRHALSSFSTSTISLSAHVDAMHHHFTSYYSALDLAASNDVASTLRNNNNNPIQLPFLWLGDFHPYLFTNLLRSFLDDGDQDSDQYYDDDHDELAKIDFLERPWHVETAWRSPSRALTTRVHQIECGLRLMVPALAARAREAQERMVERVGVEWGRGGLPIKNVVAEAVKEEMEELVGVVVDANRLRVSVLADVLSVTSVYQAALFLEALGGFVVGFHDDKLVREFCKCDVAIN